MIAHGEMKARLQGMLEDDSDETAADITRYINMAYFAIVQMHPWNMHLKSVTIKSSRILPSDLLRPYYLQDDTDFIYFHTGPSGRYQNSRLYNWFMNRTQASALDTASDMVVTANSTSVTSATGGFSALTLDTDFIKIGNNVGIYEISAVASDTELTLAKGFRGASATAQTFFIRPEGTQKILLTNEQGAEISSATVTLQYLATPLPVYNDYDSILLPGDCEAVYQRAGRYLNEQAKYTNDSLRSIPDYDAALSDMKALDPIQSRDKAPRDRFGNRFKFGREKYQSSIFYNSNNRAVL